MSTRTAVLHSATSTLLIGLLAFGSPAQAETFSRFKEVSAAAAQGDPRSQTVLGNMYHDGWGVEKEIAKALEWYRKAAEQGHADGQFALGHEYATGHGVPVDLAKATELFRKAAIQGHGAAQYRLGTHYQNGKGVPKDAAKALEWYEKSAASGFHKGQVVVATRYAEQGNFGQALALYQAAAPHNSGASTSAGIMHLYGIGTPENPAEAAEYFLPVLTKDIKAKMFYGLMLLDGLGVERDTETGGKYLTEAAEQGVPDAMFALAEAMHSGTYISPGAGLAAAYSDKSTHQIMKEEARTWYQKAAAAGQELAQERLRKLYP